MNTRQTSPYEAARAVYLREPCARSFEEDLELHLRYGYVFSTSRFFIMMRPVLSTAAPGEILRPWVGWPGELCDCWHVYLMAGSLREVWRILPRPLPKVSFERNNILRVLDARRLQRQITKTP